MIFISYNSKHQELARMLAMSLTSLGHGVWFDKWELAAGSVLSASIKAGLAASDVLVLLWSAEASKSKWVALEIETYRSRMTSDPSLRLIPVLLDETPVIDDLDDLRRLHYDDGGDPFALAMTILGPDVPDDVDLAEALQQRLNELTKENADPQDPLPFLVCPKCGSRDLKRHSETDYESDHHYFMVDCNKCGWGDWSE